MTRIQLCTCCGNQLLKRYRVESGRREARWECAGKLRHAAIADEMSDLFRGSDWVRRVRFIEQLGPEAMSKIAAALGIKEAQPTDWADDT